MKKSEISERQKFLDIYTEFNKWLSVLGFRVAHHWNESATAADIEYSHYRERIDSLHSVEHYIHDGLDFSIRFLRDRFEHKFMFVGNIGEYSDVFSIDQTKEVILNDFRRLRDEKMAQLNKISSF